MLIYFPDDPDLLGWEILLGNVAQQHSKVDVIMDLKKHKKNRRSGFMAVSPTSGRVIVLGRP